ncbi:uncharacterized protein [Bemisia tabaci]
MIVFCIKNTDTLCTFPNCGKTVPKSPKLHRGYSWLDASRTLDLTPGNVFKHPVLSEVLMIENELMVSLEYKVRPLQKALRLTRYCVSDTMEKGWQLKAVKESITEEVRQKRIALATMLVDRDLPYEPFLCNLGHWWNYILYGKRPLPWWPRHCPLAKSWDDFTVEQIKSGEFELSDGYGLHHDFPVQLESDGVYFECFGPSMARRATLPKRLSRVSSRSNLRSSSKSSSRSLSRTVDRARSLSKTLADAVGPSLQMKERSVSANGN